MARGKWRMYFGRGGVELKDHPLNGMAWNASGSCVHHKEPGHKHREGMAVGCPKHEVSGYKLDAHGNEVGKEKFVTVDDFGGKPVLVKIWHPDRPPEYFRLTGKA